MIHYQTVRQSNFLPHINLRYLFRRIRLFSQSEKCYYPIIIYYHILIILNIKKEILFHFVNYFIHYCNIEKRGVKIYPLAVNMYERYREFRLIQCGTRYK